MKNFIKTISVVVVFLSMMSSYGYARHKNSGHGPSTVTIIFPDKTFSSHTATKNCSQGDDDNCFWNKPTTNESNVYTMSPGGDDENIKYWVDHNGKTVKVLYAHDFSGQPFWHWTFAKDGSSKLEPAQE